jgi:hypothetical protein
MSSFGVYSLLVSIYNAAQKRQSNYLLFLEIVVIKGHATASQTRQPRDSSPCNDPRDCGLKIRLSPVQFLGLAPFKFKGLQDFGGSCDPLFCDGRCHED